MTSMDKEQVLLSIVQAGELEVDTQGRIWRIAKRGGNPRWGSFSTRPCPKVRGEYRQRQGYLLVTSTSDGVKTVTGAHRLVWAYFNGPIPAGMTINHINGMKDDNRPENLELATMSDQRRHAIRVLNVNRNRPKGSKHPKTALDESDVIMIRQMRSDGVMVKDIAQKYQMKSRAISAICNRRTWKHI